MARAIFLALTFAMASGARYDDDYSGIKMLQYGSAADYDGPRDVHSAPADDYHDHSHDAHVPLDYKDDDEPRGISKMASIEEVDREFERSESWHGPEKKIKHKRPTQNIDDINADQLDKDNPDEEIPKIKSSSRISRHRSRLKDAKSWEKEGDADALRFAIKHNRNKNERNIRDMVPDDTLQSNYGVDRQNKKAHYENEQISTTPRKVRRKPRDRFVKHADHQDTDEYDYQKIMNDPHRMGQDQIPGRMIGNRLPGNGQQFDYPEMEETVSSLKQKFDKRPKEYKHYDDYYDMKRVNNMRNNVMPTLIRRTTLKEPQIPTLTSLAPGVPNLTWENRRLAPWPSPITLRSTTLVITMKTRPSTTSTRTTTTTKTTTTTPTTSTLPTTLKLMDLATKVELSLAEKSRLSILRKALRKETKFNETSTKKPPVLLLVTGKMQTMVIVEPATSESPMMRANEVEVSNDSPQQLNMVKRMMRHKLVASARSIHDLTDNWDELVCDYIDTSLLESSSNVINCSFVLSGLSVCFSMMINLL